MNPLDFTIGAVAGVFGTLWTMVLIDAVADWRQRRARVRTGRDA